MKNLRVYSLSKKLNKINVHSLVKWLSSELSFTILNLDINFISGKFILGINKQYLKHNCTTDIITFNYSAEEKQIDGEMFISMDDALVNSRRYKVAFSDELVRLIIHGILHLLGYDDINNSEKKTMKRIENKLLSKNKFVLLQLEKNQ